MKEDKNLVKKVSLIIPIYNAERYLEKCIQSACRQTYSNLEIICVDDGSTDASGKMADAFKQKDSRVKVIHQENQGESAARNCGLKMASGDYVGFLDCDDWIEEDMYEKLVEKIESTDADIAISGWYMEKENESILIENEKKVDKSIFSRNELLNYLYERDSYREFAYMWNKLYKREILIDEYGQLLLFDTNLRLGGDVLYLGSIALNVGKAVYMNKAFYHYLQRVDSGSHSKKLNQRKDWLQAYLMLIDLYKRKGIEQRVLDLLKRFLVYHSANTAQMAYEQKDNDMLTYCKEIIEKYRMTYQLLNKDKPERLIWLEQIAAYQL